MFDILFFSSQSLSEEGIISDSTEEENYIRKLMMKSARKKIFLCDSGKFNQVSTYKLCTLQDVDAVVFDQTFSADAEN